MFYTYRQNNSGGSFIVNEDVDVYVIVEADSPEQADVIAESKGIYFNGCDLGWDCDCCGDRWYRAYGWDAAEQPEIYGEIVEDQAFQSGLGKAGVIIYYKSGEVKRNR